MNVRSMKISMKRISCTDCVEHLCYILLSMSVFKMYVDIFYHMDHVSEINDLFYLILSIHGTISTTIQLSESGNIKVLSTKNLVI